MADLSTGELWVIAVLPGFEERGIGSELLRLAEDYLWSAGWKKIWLLTSADTALRAYLFYRKRGWHEAGAGDFGLRMEKQPDDQAAESASLRSVTDLER